MRWVPFLILVWVVVLLQTTFGRALTITTSSLGAVAPDLAALVAVFVAFYVRTWPDAMLGGWALGLAIDLTTSGGAGAGTAVGPMAVAYAVTAALLFRVREAFFRERALTQGVLALAFCLLAHGTWVAAQTLLARGDADWSAYGRTMLQAAALACYTAVLMPLAHLALGKIQRLFLATPVGPGRRG
jgi:rod shape-determining protein MreD